LLFRSEGTKVQKKNDICKCFRKKVAENYELEEKLYFYECAEFFLYEKFANVKKKLYLCMLIRYIDFRYTDLP